MSGNGRIALLLPGQGTQSVGMGKAFAEAFPEARALYDEADALLGHPLSRICWEGPAETLTATENAQPAILLHSYVVWRCLPERVRNRVVVAAGHSLGEFTAYLTAGALDFAAALRLVRRRGELMARVGEEQPGTMAAVLGMEPEALREVCEEAEGVVVPANLNAPGQVVISGEVEAVGRASELARERGARRVLPLEVSGAFHSPLMGDAERGLRAVLEETEFRDPAFPVVANATAEPVETASEARGLLLRQLSSPVRWEESVLRMRGMGVDRWLEIGPGSVLSGLLRRIDRSLESVAVGDPASLDTLTEL